MNDNQVVKIQVFCRRAFIMLGLNIVEDSVGLSKVDIPASTVDLFEGRPSLHLAFTPELVEEGVELVIPGSYVLERLLEVVRQRGLSTSISIDPVKPPRTDPGIKLINAEARFVGSRQMSRNLLLIVFRIALISDEDTDHLYRVLVDTATCEQLDIDPEAILNYASKKITNEVVDKDTVKMAFASARGLATEFARNLAGSTQIKIENRLRTEMARLDQYYAEVLADTSNGSRSADIRKIQKQREKTAASCDTLDEVYAIATDLLKNAENETQLHVVCQTKTQELKKLHRKLQWSYGSNFTEMARCEKQLQLLTRAIAIAEKAVKNIAGTALDELEKQKQQAIAAIHCKAEQVEAQKFESTTLERLEDIKKQLDCEKKQRIEELQDKFQLKVVITPISASLIKYPMVDHHYEAISGSTIIPFTSTQDLVTGKLNEPTCQSCHKPLSEAYVCACGHLACSGCYKTCVGCGRTFCAACVTASCQICGGVVCDTCRNTCQSCGKVICPEHSTKCSECGAIVCSACSKTCQICGHGFCQKHIEACPICHASVCLNDTRVCSKCGLRACKVDVADCHICGEAVCADHSVTCPTCGERVCRSCLSDFGQCVTCDGLFPSESSAASIEAILMGSGLARKLTSGRWLLNESKDRFVLARSGIRTQVYSIDKATGRIKCKNRLGMWDSIKLKLRLSSNSK